jgi:uncharacterized protein
VHDQELAVEAKPMTIETAAKVVDRLDDALAHAETLCIHLYGGEPLTNLPAIEAMVDQAFKKKPGRFRFAVTTNGVISNPLVFQLLEKGKFQVILSIDGPEEIHDKYRRTVNGKATHAGVLRFLENLRTETQCWIRASSVVRPGWGLKNAVEYLSGLSVDAVKAQAVRVKSGSPFEMKDSEKQRYLKDLEEIGRNIIAELEAGLVPKDDRFSSRVLQILAGKKRESFCGAGYSSFGITPDGTVLSCILLDKKEAALGHINDDQADWVKRGGKWRKDHQPGNDCYQCDALELCGGGCYVMNPLCGEEECTIVRKNCEVATLIYNHFKTRPEKLLALAGIM